LEFQWKKYNYYVELKDSPEEIDTPEKQDFVNTLDEEAIGKLEEIRKRMNDSITSDSLSLVDSKYMNNAIVPNNDMEQKMKDVNDYYLRLLLEKGNDAISFDAVDENTMRQLAALCPSIYGPGVYAIRSILSRFDTVPTDYISPCEATLDPNGNNSNNARKATITPKLRDANEPDFTDMDESALNSISYRERLDISLFPNPAQNTLYIENNMDIQFTYQLLDARGAIVLDGNNFNNTKPFAISTEKLSNGLYVLKITDSKNLTTSFKVSIQK
jgi:hypothetical protein